MASNEELLISRSSTFLSRRAFAASSFIASNTVCVPLGLMGLAEPGDGRAENKPVGDIGGEPMLSVNEPLLTTRFSVCNGLGSKTGGSLANDVLRSVTESIEERLALLPWVPLIMYDAALERLLERSGTSGVLGPDNMDIAELRDAIDGRMT
jgi:hypothetical protein